MYISDIIEKNGKTTKYKYNIIVRIINEKYIYVEDREVIRKELNTVKICDKDISTKHNTTIYIDKLNT